MELQKNETLGVLHTGQKFIQNETHFKYGIDAVLLSDFAAKEIRNKNSVLELGCGNGINCVLLSKLSRAQKITGLEIQKECFELAQKNVQINELEKKVQIVLGNIKNVKNLIFPQSFDCVISNPPYMKKSKGKICKNNFLAIARSEIECTLEDVIFAATWSLKSNGNFFMIHRPERIQEVLFLLQKYNLGAKTIQFICPFQNEKPTMFLIHAKKDFFPETKIEQNLVISNDDATYTKELLKIYNNTSLGANCAYMENPTN